MARPIEYVAAITFEVNAQKAKIATFIIQRYVTIGGKEHVRKADSASISTLNQQHQSIRSRPQNRRKMERKERKELLLKTRYKEHKKIIWNTTQRTTQSIVN